MRLENTLVCRPVYHIRHYYDVRAMMVHVLKMVMFMSKLPKSKLALLELVRKV